MRKRENKNYRYVPSLPDALQKIPKKNCKKIKKTPLWLHLKPEYVGKVRERKKITIVVPFRSYPTRNRKVQKQNKNSKKSENTIMAPFQATTG